MNRKLEVRLTGVIALSLALGCSTEEPAPGSPGITPVAQVVPTDPEINPNDTYVVLDAEITTTSTITFAQPITDPATGQTVSQLTLPDAVDTQFSLEAGYDGNGVLRMTLTGQWVASVDAMQQSVPEAYRLVLSNGQLYEYAGSGELVPLPVEAESLPSATQLLANLGSQLLYGNITEGILLDSITATPEPQVSVRSDTGASNGPDGSGRVAASSRAGARDRGRNRESRTERHYSQRDGRRVLDEILVTTEVDHDNGDHHRLDHRTRLRNVRWRQNLTLDSVRATRVRDDDRRSTRDTSIDSGFPTLTRAPMPVLNTEDLCDLECGDGGGGEEGGGSGGGSGGGTGGGSGGAPGRNVVFQHGLNSGPGVWNRMSGWLVPEFVFGSVVKPTLSSQSRAQYQTDQLVSTLDATGKTGFLVIGHSLGGLVGRRIAQQRPDLVNGVLTVGTPHQGALLTMTSRATLTGILNGYFEDLYEGCPSSAADVGCYLAAAMYFFGIPALADYAVDEAVPATQDLLPVQFTSNPFVSNLNAAPESFTRVGIQSYSAKRWVFFRWLADLRYFPDAEYGGRNMARYAGRFYSAARVCQVISAIIEAPYLFYICTRIIDTMNSIDRWWDRMTAPGDRTDAIVQGSSQVYPNATFNYPILGGDSHAGEPNSSLVRERIASALDLQFQVVRIP